MSGADIEVHGTQPGRAIARVDELAPQDLVWQVNKIQQAMELVMRDGEHFGVIPGTDKPTLLKPGAEKLCLMFRLAPSYEREMLWHDDGHLTAIVTCSLHHITTGDLIAQGEGLCSTRESKYAYRNANRVCPACGAEAIIKGKAEYGGGWLCWKKRDGCNAKFPDGDPAIESQQAGKVPNEQLPDTFNTVLKMACKRALVAAALNGTAASDIFTQDVEDTAPAPAATEPQEGKAPRIDRLRARVLERVAEADAKRTDGKQTLDEVLQVVGAKALDDATEEKLTHVGGELAEWIAEGCPGVFTEFKSVPF